MVLSFGPELQAICNEAGCLIGVYMAALLCGTPAAVHASNFQMDILNSLRLQLIRC